MATRSVSAKSRGLRGNVDYAGCVGQNIFYVGHNFYVGCVGQFFDEGQNFLLESDFLRGRKFLREPVFWMREKGVGGGSKDYLD